MSRWVVHCKKEAYGVYIGRAVPRSGFKASISGNPFKLEKDGTRDSGVMLLLDDVAPGLDCSVAARPSDDAGLLECRYG